MPKIQRMKLADLKPADYNPRTISQVAMAGLAASVARFGCVQPIIWNKRTEHVVGGHQRLAVLLEQGKRVADVVVVDLPLKEEKALNVALNSPAIAGEFTPDLDALLDEIQTGTPDIYADLLLAELREDGADPVEVVEDDVPEVQDDPVTRPGDLWLLGDHRVLCGDSTQDVSFVSEVDLVWTDPPYGVSYVGKTKDALTIQSDGDEFAETIRAAFAGAVGRCKPGAVWYVAAPPGPQFYDFASVLRDLRIWRETLVWVKDSMVLGHSDFHYQHEAIFYGWVPGEAHRAPPDRCQVTVWTIPRPKASRDHPTTKPVALVAKAIGISSKPGDTVYDPFLGSGTTLIAAEQLGRKCYGIEIEPRYVDVVLRRWVNLTGEPAVRESDGAKIERGPSAEAS